MFASYQEITSRVVVALEFVAVVGRLPFEGGGVLGWYLADNITITNCEREHPRGETQR